MSRLLQWPWLEALFWVSVLAVVVVFPSDLSLATAIAVMALFAVSLDLALGIAGILTLGHALYFGAGAYAAAALATLGWAEPVSGVVLAGIAAALLAGVAGPFILRSRGLPLIMVTLVLGLFAFELANKASDFTGGDNGLSDIVLAPVLGVFHWSVYAQVEYLYVLAFLFVGFQGAKRIVGSPFGLALRGIRDNPVRMAYLGAPVQSHLLRAYLSSALLAGVAGALSAQTTRFVGTDVLSINASIDVLVMLVLGGTGSLYGALVGAIVYMLVHHLAAEWNPYHWMFIIGALLVFVVRIGEGGLVGIARRITERSRQKIGRRAKGRP